MIYNMVHVAEDLGTAGQPTTAQLAAIKEAGYEVVINADFRGRKLTQALIIASATLCPLSLADGLSLRTERRRGDLD